MKEKRVWKFFSIAEQEKEQAFLRQMHRAGWKLVRVGGLCRQIAQASGMDPEAACIAGLLHDAAYGMDVPADYDWNNHGRDSARIARPFLNTLGLDAQVVEDICYGIAIHVDDQADFAGRRTPFAETVGDADNML